ncbi:12153_t:CDS:2 [Acaulospora morrowiae]|uniref:12153_t:CDS:1 n=1 Tax=Acaulospora morrowiae TaxID=94023 RepID=A0A9N9D232_9GLOM|nr:12153_t:CDS:2 [Acaulospora morrowiae]
MYQILKVLTVCLMFVVEYALSQAPSAQPAPQQEHYIGTVRQKPNSPDIPSNISVPSGSTFSFLLYGSGKNEWLCQSGSWVLNNVTINLINNDNGHFDPSWEVASLFWQSTPINGGRATFKSLLDNDTSSIITKPDSSVASPDGTDNINWERQVVNSVPGGAFSNISYVLTISTKRGISPSASTCGVQFQNNAKTSVDFTATYYFYAGSPPNTTTAGPNSPTVKSDAVTTRLSRVGQLGWVSIVGFIAVGVLFF